MGGIIRTHLLEVQRKPSQRSMKRMQDKLNACSALQDLSSNVTGRNFGAPSRQFDVVSTVGGIPSQDRLTLQNSVFFVGVTGSVGQALVAAPGSRAPNASLSAAPRPPSPYPTRSSGGQYGSGRATNSAGNSGLHRWTAHHMWSLDRRRTLGNPPHWPPYPGISNAGRSPAPGVSLARPLPDPA